MASERTGNEQIRKIFVGGLSRDTTTESLHAYFATWGGIDEAIVMKDNHTGNSRGFGFVVFDKPEDVDNLLATKRERQLEFSIDGRSVEVKRALPRGEGAPVNTGGGPTQRSGKIFVGGVAAGTTEDDLKDYFQQYGTILDVELLVDKTTGRLRGFGFVTFQDEDVADKVCIVREHPINKKTCEVKKAQPRGAVKPPQRRERQEPSYNQGRYGNRSSGGQYQDYPPQQNQSQNLLLTGLIQQLTAAQGLNQIHDGGLGGGGPYGNNYQSQQQQQQPANPLAALGAAGLGNTNNLLLATLLSNNNMNTSSLGLGNLNLLGLLAAQNNPGRGLQQGWDGSDQSAGPVQTYDYSQSSVQQPASAEGFGYSDPYASQYNQGQSNFGAMKQSPGKPGGPGPNKGYKPY